MIINIFIYVYYAIDSGNFKLNMCCDYLFSVIGAGCLSSAGLDEIKNHAWFSDVEWATVGQVDETGAETGRFFWGAIFLI
eukprot:COSAG06_NODE_1163_length_10454_cov_16.507677_9_plen_80_part_00